MNPKKRYTVGSFTGTIKEMMTITGLTPGGVYLRLRRWRAGEIPVEEVFEFRHQGYSFSGKKAPAARGEWQGLSGRVRNENLAKIPEPSPFERGV